MNSDKVESLSSPSVPTSTGRRVRVRPVKKPSISHQEASLLSIPSDNENDWVSPFTLPPLPAFKKQRSQVDRSPEERGHNRAGSSAYYAAAWGSPYATPSPYQSPAQRLTRKRSLDLESSPLASRSFSVNKSSARHARQQSLPAQDSLKSTDLPLSPSPVDKEQRRNWLSESEDSDGGLVKDSGKTPTRRKSAHWATAPSSARSHHINESVDTVTLETFNGASGIEAEQRLQAQLTNMAEAQISTPSLAGDKPLPSLPYEPSVSVQKSIAQSRPTLPAPAQSFNRPKKKVYCKGKSCIIAMPTTDREEAGLPPVLTSQEKQDILQKWLDLGYPIHGFNVGDWGGNGASRPIFPDAADMDYQRKNEQTNVRIPDPAEWQAWVDYLFEEKLRALGVAPSSTEAPPSTMSPFSSTISRVSSAYPSMVPSPPVPTHSAAGMRPHMTHSPFSPSISNPSMNGFPFPIPPQRGTPGLPGGRGMHGYTQSVAFPGVGNRVGSPYDLSSQQGPYRNSVRSPDGSIPGRSPWLPGHVQNMQSMANLISPVNPPPQDLNRGFTQSPQLAHMQAIQRQQEALARQQQQVQQRIANHHRQMSMFPMRGVSSEQVNQLPLTPKATSPAREPPEIMQPTPRSHRHNRDLSAALEKEVTDQVAASSKGLAQALDGAMEGTRKTDQIAEELEDGEVAEERDDQEELPILHRPETLKNNDADEKAEIETNPSRGSTPLLLDDKNPFANFKPLAPSEPLAKRPGFAHSAQPSLSKLNVQAKEFSPVKATFSPQAGTFNFDGNAFASRTSSPGKSAVAGSRLGHKHNPSSLGLNIAAPEFKPTFSAAPAQINTASVAAIPSFNDKLSNIDDISEESAAGEAQDLGRDNVHTSTEPQPASEPSSSAFSFAAGNDIGSITPAKPAFDPRSSTFSFSGVNESETSTPAKSAFDPKSSTFSTFSFGSTTLNVEAPEFKPSGISLSSIDFTPEKPKNFSSGLIFGDVMIDSASKAERRTKALPIVMPASRDGSAAPESQENFGADGRAVAPVDRNKRARKAEAEDEEVVFADSAPFTSLADEEALEKEDKVLSYDDEPPQSEAENEDEGRPETSETVVEPSEADQQPETLDAADAADDDSVTAHLSVDEATRSVDRSYDKQEEIIEDTKEISPVQESRPVGNTNDVGEEQQEVITESTAEPASISEFKTPEHTTPSAVSTEGVTSAEQDEKMAEALVPPSPAAKEEPNSMAEETVEAKAQTPVSEPIAAAADEIKPGPTVNTLSAEAPIFQPTLSAYAPAFEPNQPKTPALSASATSFDHKPEAQKYVPPARRTAEQPEAVAAKRQTSGLMASRFAASPSPEPAAPETGDSDSSAYDQELGPQKMSVPTAEEEPMAELVDTEQPAAESVIPESIDARPGKTRNILADDYEDGEPGPAVDESEEEHSASAPAEQKIIDTLERFKEHDSRSGSVVSRTGDLSYEEINAVMKQFDDNPELGVIREDSPVKATPLIDMRYPQQFRSDAPSPSPHRRLDKPFDADRKQPYKGLGFELSGVHQLNYGGSGEVSDWNADLSPGQQDKLEARAHFFDDHVNDLVDNVIESRLAPLERLLREVTTKLSQQPAAKSRHSRRSMSTENKDSDADDEDDYDAYEGYQHYRSRSPKKRARGQELIKAAVAEAWTMAQAGATEASRYDLSSIANTLTELRELQKAAAQPQQPAINGMSLQEVLAELMAFTQQKPAAPVIDTTELMQTIAEMKSIAQQRAADPPVDVQAVQSILAEIREVATQKAAAPAVDLSAIQQSLADLKALTEKPREQQSDLKSVLEDVIGSHPRLRGSRVEQDHGGSQKLEAKINDLEAMLKVAEKRAEGEASLRREAEEENDQLQHLLKEARDQAALHKEASEEAQKSLEAFVQEKQEYRGMNNEVQDLRHRNESLEELVDEYRKFKDQAKEELDAERRRTDNLAQALQAARHQHQDHAESRDILREQLSRIQDRINTVMQDVRHDEAEFRKREHDLLSKNELLQAALDHETNRRARMELEAEKLNKEHRESLVYRSKHDGAQEEVSRLASIIVNLQAEIKQHQDSAYQAQRELAFATEKHDEIVDSRTARLHDDLDATKSSLHNLQADADARIARLQGQLDAAAIELQESKAKHESNMEKMFDNHNQAIRRANEKHAAELDRRLAVHEEKLIDIRGMHNRDLKNAEEDRKALEHRYVEKLDLSNDKVQHLESKIRDLEERLEISSQAARAAVAAAAKNVNLPTPANSVIASPPHRASISTGSMPLIRGSELPEKISPQALRETIMVLQDQLQNREQKIDKLEAELNAVDKEAPARVRERDTEIVMLRELLEVRVDDLQELIATLEKPEYSRAAVKDAAIRLKTQIKMEQQLKERAITGANMAANLPTSITSGLVNLTQSPRAMVAAAAWGNWRKVRESGMGSAVSDFASNIGSQTPSRSSSTSSNILAGMMTPTATNRSPSDKSRPSTARPLASAAAARKAGPGSPAPAPRPLRSFSTQPRTMSGARQLARRGTNESTGSVIRGPSSMTVEPPSTPLQLAVESDFGDDVDDDPSPLDGKYQGFDSDDVEEPVKPAPKPASPRVSRSSHSSSGKPASPRALNASAATDCGDYVEVIEED